MFRDKFGFFEAKGTSIPPHHAPDLPEDRVTCPSLPRPDPRTTFLDLYSSSASLPISHKTSTTASSRAIQDTH